jgi:hypothetical protein
MMITEALNVLRTVSKVINNVDSTTGQQKGRNYVEYALVLVIGIGIGMTVHKLSVAIFMGVCVYSIIYYLLSSF